MLRHSMLIPNAPLPLVGNGIGQIPLGRVAFDRVMAADEIERANKTIVTAAIAKATSYPTPASAYLSVRSSAADAH